jgi:serine/threonine protein kinase
MATYEVTGVIGRGGMGVVLKAFDPALSRKVAIKVLSPALASCGAARRRFLREARAAAAVVHEHVVGVFAVVESASVPFLVMEYVPGRSLQDRLDRQGALALAEVLRIGMQTAAGLAAAHAQGIVHRDIKPANILLENGVERVRLSDFGLARAVDDAGLTRSGVIAGTPHYMAPEQASGETTDQRADLFSLGSTLYAMCAGHPPFRAETPLAVLRRVCDDRPRPLRELNPEVPDWLTTIISRLMEKSPDRRYHTAAEVAALLERCLAHVQQPLLTPLPVELAPGPDQRSFWSPARVRVAISALAVAAALAVLTWMPSSLWRGNFARHERDDSRSLDGAQDQSLNPGPSRTDELAEQLEEAWNLTRSLEAGLISDQEAAVPDPVSMLARELAESAANLEREISSPAADWTHGVRVPRPSFPNLESPHEN